MPSSRSEMEDPVPPGVRASGSEGTSGTDEPAAGEASRRGVLSFFRISKTREAQGGLGTFQGVYRPTVLTILGVMMYLREG